jgi:hypothetical protein
MPPIRLAPPPSPTRSDARRGSIEIVIAKAYTAVAFSSNQQATDSRTLGRLSRLDVPQLGAANPGTNTGPAPLFSIGDTNLYRPLTGTPIDDAVGLRHHGLVTFAGGQPAYDCQGGGLLGGLEGARMRSSRTTRSPRGGHRRGVLPAALSPPRGPAGREECRGGRPDAWRGGRR